MSTVQPLLRRFLAIAVAATALTSAIGADMATTWATATSTRPADGHQIVFRFVKDFPPTFDRSSWPERIILTWRYESTNGMPSAGEREAMDRMEDLLAPHVVASAVATLVLVSTGDNLREWTYYARSEDAFLIGLNQALASEPRLPIEIHIAPDRQWSTYEAFRRGLQLP